MPEKPNREAFEKQCEEISNKLDNLSDWEMEFYLYCLIPKYDEKIREEINKIEIKTPRDVFILNGLRGLDVQLRTMILTLSTGLF